jgi:hypothetical protein
LLGWVLEHADGTKPLAHLLRDAPLQLRISDPMAALIKSLEPLLSEGVLMSVQEE